MKKPYSIIFIALAGISATIIAVADNPVNTEPCQREKYETAEPGTCLDPRTYRLLRTLEKVDTNPYNNEFAKKVLDMFEPRVKKVIDTIVIYKEATVPVRIYYPTNKSLIDPTRVIFFIHGGGFMYGSIEEYDMAVKKLARVTEMIVVALDYRLAPEFPYPAALNDIEAVKTWIITNMNQIGGKGKKIVLIGDSAGANLATVLALKLRDEHKDQVLCQVLYYPPTTFMEKEFPSRVYFLRDERRTYILTEEFVRETKAAYLPDSIRDDNPYVSPLEADLRGTLPPALILCAQIDPVRDDGKFYSEKLALEGQDVRYVEYKGITHGFFNFYMIFREGLESMKIIKEYIAEMTDKGE